MSVPADRNHPYRQKLYRVLEERVWLDEHIEELLPRYKAQWIAVYGREIIAAAGTPEEVIARCQEQGVELDLALIFNVPGEIHTPV
ncbi:MAG: hypothetical protein D9V47_08520 [Clostridia bacterium]|nr:MAG: hypothetical protein D9V47_08520 [Clostridia bacterium]